MGQILKEHAVRQSEHLLSVCRDFKLCVKSNYITVLDCQTKLAYVLNKNGIDTR